MQVGVLRTGAAGAPQQQQGAWGWMRPLAVRDVPPAPLRYEQLWACHTSGAFRGQRARLSFSSSSQRRSVPFDGHMLSKSRGALLFKGVYI